MSEVMFYQVGASTVDITPSLERPVYLAGFAPNRKAKEVLHPLCASALYIKDPWGSAVCLVSLDLIGFFNPEIQRIRQKVADLIPSDRLLVCSTHAHSGPDTMGMWGKGLLGIPFKSGVDPQYISFVVDKVAQGVQEAIAKAEPATLASVTFDCPADWVRNDRKSSFRYPRTTALIAQAGNRIPAMLVNFAAHPETLWEHNHALSPDYPAPFRSALKELGVETPLFFSGPLGAMLTPNVDPKSTAPQRRDYIEKLGKDLAQLSHQKIPEAKTLSGAVSLVHKECKIANLNGRFNLVRKLGLFNREIPDGFLLSEMNQLAIGNLRIATVPGEACPEVGHMIYDAMFDGDRMIFCLGCDELGYIMPSNYFIDPEYKYETTMSLGPHMAHLVISNVFEQRFLVDHARRKKGTD